MAEETQTPALNDHQEQDEQLDVPLDSPALIRLINEVQSEEVDVSRSYNRTYNRHNR